MDWFLLAGTAIGQFVAEAFGWVLGRKYHLDPDKARRLGELVLVLLLAAVLAVITVAYSK